jgi:5-methylcytosine-specific restriction endonuclease McrA
MIDPNSYKYQKWRRLVMYRDGQCCQKCGLYWMDNETGKSNRLHVHHIKPKSIYPELTLEVSNGITLCSDCHRKEHKKAGG